MAGRTALPGGSKGRGGGENSLLAVAILIIKGSFITLKGIFITTEDTNARLAGLAREFSIVKGTRQIESMIPID